MCTTQCGDKEENVHFIPIERDPHLIYKRVKKYWCPAKEGTFRIGVQWLKGVEIGGQGVKRQRKIGR